MEKKEILERVKVLAGVDNPNEDEISELEKLNGQLSAIKAKEDAVKLMAQADADAELARDEETKKQIEEAVKAEREKLEAAGRRLPDGNAAPYAT